jgi:DNA-binding NtrC family response regulator
MSDGLDVIIVDDEQSVCEVTTEIIKKFYTWGDVVSFTDYHEALTYCRKKKAGVAIFVLDVFMGRETGFGFLDAIADKFPMAYEDTIIMTGKASDDVVNMCIASNITYLVEKPMRPYTLQMAVRAIVAKYIRFAKKLMEDPGLAETVARI